ncbi:MAG: deoxyguanosinetriphosphate triphosphohydrolase [Dehalococcoidia bacterium]|nr:deoxyguanosinetriphosphate triphosphohydrolase [Dehalococcoidia bacterium]
MDRHHIRLRLEEKEELLSPYAAKSKLAERDRPEEPSPMRTEFQRDRDRIIHSKAFRRLKHKTQVFIAPSGDHYVTRLTHTLEVSQIARTIARALNLNEDLAEAISLGHDLGHTPFGHVGEEVLNEIYPGGFSHNLQSVRVVEILEKEGEGLNLTREVREGILKHSKSREGILGENWETPSTLEGQVCKIADTIAYINHDIADALRAGLITADDLPQSAIAVLGDSHSARINTLVSDVVEHSWAATGLNSLLVREGNYQPMIALSPAVLEAMNALRDFLFERVYEVRAMKEESERARGVVRSLYYYFLQNPHELPEEFIGPGQGVERGVVDYIAGMTDLFALSKSKGILK